MRVVGFGPKPANVMLVGEAPGKDEDRIGRPFVGKSGKELDRILHFNGLERSEIYVTNICKERPPYTNGKQQPPSKADIERDEQELIQELLEVQPKWIGAVGRVSTQWFLGPEASMEACHGLPYGLSVRVRGMVLAAAERRADRGTDTGESSHSVRGVSPARLREEQVHDLAGLHALDYSWLDNLRIIPLYHPAAGMHNADLQPFVWWDIQQFSWYVQGYLHPGNQTDKYAGNEQYVEYVHGQRERKHELLVRPVACDTEGLPGNVWGGSVSYEAGTAGVIHVRDSQQLGEVLEQASTVIYHNSLHDVPILEEMGIPADWSKVEDTFLMAYVLRLVPMGLKQLSRRFCGMVMQAYTDVIAPAERRLAMEYVEKALSTNACSVCDGTGKVPEMRKDGKGWKKQPVKCSNFDGDRPCIDGGFWPAREPQLKYDWDTGTWKLSKGWSVGRYLAKLRTDMRAGKYEEVDEDTGETLSVRDRIENWPDDVLEIIQSVVGEMPEPTLDDIDPEAATYYSARDADATIRIYPILSQQVDQLELRPAYKLDLSVIPVAAEMQKNGMYIDRPYFEKFVEELEHDNNRILANLEAAVGKPINPASGDQVAGLLFGERGLKYSSTDRRNFTTDFDLDPEKYTKSGKRGSTDDKTLEGLKLKHADDKELVRVIDLILDYRIRSKILGTYARKLPIVADEFGRIHTTIKPCRTATFRWASSDPNLQNIPTKKKNNVDLGRRVRQGFVAPPGYVLGSWDFDQIEMRVLAWYSQDENLLRVFREGLDIHSMTAALVWRVPLEQFLAEKDGSDPELARLRADQRASGKNIGFGVVYGVTAKGLRAQMELRGQHWTEEECQKLIDMYLYEAYPGVGRFMMDAHAEARRTGMVRSLFGHIRYCPGVHSSIPSVREEALRQAANFKIQATASELLKLSMKRLWYEYKPTLDEVGAKILMAVHDELLLEVPDNEEAKSITDSVVTAAMTNPYVLAGVEVGTTGKYAENWGLLK